MKTLYKIGMLAVAALAFAGCAKEVDNSADQKTGTHTLTFTVQKDFDTRTAVVEGDGVASYVWTEKDDDYFHIYENGVEATEITMALSEDNKIATFKATFANTGATEFTYRATYGSDLASSTPHNPLIPADQSPSLESFDPAADVLVSAEDIVLEGNAQADENTEFLFKLKRVVSVNKMTLKGLTPGERVTSVELTGDQYFSSRYSIDKATYTGNAKKLVLDYLDLDEAIVGDDGTFPVYFVSAPFENASFGVRAVTESTVYTRDDFTSKLTLAVGTFRRFGVNLAGYGESVSEGTVYTLVESQDDLYDGATYIIAATDVNVAMGLYGGGNNHPAVTLNKGTDASGKTIITVDNTVEVEPITIVSNGNTWHMKNAASGNTYEGQYLICAMGSNNRLQETDSEESALKDWTINISEGAAIIVNANSSAVRTRVFYNNSNDIFACYAPDNTQYKGVSLFVDKSTCVAHPQIIVSPSAITNVSYRGVEDADDITFTLKDLTGTVEVTCDGATVTEAIDVDNTIVYSVARNDGEDATAREGWIKIAVGEVSETVTVSQAAPPSTEIILGGLTDGKVYVGANAGDKVTFTVTANYKWVADWDYTINVNGVDESFSFSPTQGNADEIENNSTTVTVTADLANEGTEDRFLGEIDVYRDPELYGYAPEYVKVMVWQLAPQAAPDPAGTGAWDDPYNAAAALEEIDKLADGGYSSEVFVSGIISQIDEINTQYGNATYYITSGNATVEVFRGKYFNGVNFSADNQLVVGDDVTVYGKLQKYVKDGVVTPEIAQGNVLFELKGEIHMMTPTVSAETDNNAKTITVTWNAVAAATSYDVTCGTLSQTNLTATTTTFTMADYGKYDITVTAKASGLASVDGTTSATLTDPSSSTPDPETLTFSDKYNADTELNGVTLTGNNYSISFATGTGSNPPKYYKSGTAARIYGGNTVTITTSTGALSTIVFTCNTDTYASNLKAMTFSSGTATVSGSTVTWTGNASNLTITNSGTTQTRISSIVFNY